MGWLLLVLGGAQLGFLLLRAYWWLRGVDRVVLGLLTGPRGRELCEFVKQAGQLDRLQLSELMDRARSAASSR